MVLINVNVEEFGYYEVESVDKDREYFSAEISSEDFEKTQELISTIEEANRQLSSILEEPMDKQSKINTQKRKEYEDSPEYQAWREKMMRENPGATGAF